MYIASAVSYKPKNVVVGHSKTAMCVVGSNCLIDVATSYRERTVSVFQKSAFRDDLGLKTPAQAAALKAVLGNDILSFGKEEPFDTRDSYIKSLLKRSVYRVFLTVTQDEVSESLSFSRFFSNNTEQPKAANVSSGFLSSYYSPYSNYLALDVFVAADSMGKSLSDMSLFQVRVPIIGSKPQPCFRLTSSNVKYVSPIIPRLVEMTWCSDDTFGFGGLNKVPVDFEYFSNLTDEEKEALKKYAIYRVDGVDSITGYLCLLDGMYSEMAVIKGLYPGKPHFSELLFMTLADTIFEMGSEFDVKANSVWPFKSQFVSTNRANYVYVTASKSILNRDNFIDDRELMFTTMAFPVVTGSTRVNVFSYDVFSFVRYFQSAARWSCRVPLSFKEGKAYIRVILSKRANNNSIGGQEQ
ncbi:MAG: hypothetical protein KatS3mg087_0466 [Patescibacteria group bacterium]|nr:MAG: hypothetical protein KatS3mg087_0466 [Patescibacteria group bacterium]